MGELRGEVSLSLSLTAKIGVSLILLYILFLYFNTDSDISKIISDLLIPIVTTITLYLIYKAVIVTRNDGLKYYRSWQCLLVSQLFWVIGDITWAFQDLLLTSEPSIWLIFGPYLIRTVFLCAAIYLMPKPTVSSLFNYRRSIEIGMVLVSIVMVFWAFLILPLLRMMPIDTISFWLLLFSVILHFFLIYLALYLATSYWGQYKKSPVGFIVLGTLTQVIAVIFFALDTIANRYPGASWGDVGWITASLFLALAAIVQINIKPAPILEHDPEKSVLKKYPVMNLLISFIAFSIFPILVWGYYYNPQILPVMIWGGGVLVVLAVLRQFFTARLVDQSHKELIESKETYKGLLNALDDAVYVQNSQGEFLEVNQGAVKMYGYSQDEFIGHTPDFLAAPGKNDLSETLQKIEKAFHGEAQNFEWWGIRKNGEIFPKDVKLNKASYFGQEVIVAVARDISNRMAMENHLKESEEKFRMMAENIAEIFYMFDYHSGELLYISPAIERIMGIEREDIYQNPKTWLNFIHPHDQTHASQHLGKSEGLLNGEGIEYRAKTKWGDIKWFWNQPQPIKNIQGEITKVVGSIMDITSLKNTQKELELSLEEKTTLIQEIHHRVKNNMQIISSLLSLQSLHLHDDETRKIFMESNSRVKSMAMVHEKLYQSQNLAHINIAEYLEEFIYYLFTQFSEVNKGVDYKIVADPVEMDINQAIPLALIVNELVTNSMKYAYPEGSGLIQVIFQEQDENYLLTISDQGIGLPKDFDINKTKTLGLQLVNRLVKQLNGKFVLEGSPGAIFTLKLPKN